MFKKLFGIKPKEQKPELNIQTIALLDAIKERSKTDPLIGAKLGAKEVFHRLTNAMKNEKGVHIESLLCALGSLAGYSCQANLRTQAVSKGLKETAAFHIIATDDGKHYFFGDPLNNALSNSQYSVWSLVAGAAQNVGCTELIDINEIYKRTASAIGSLEFGIVHFPENHNAGDIPINYVKGLWPVIFPTVKMFCQTPSHWPVLLGIAAQEAITLGKDVISPNLALKIIMESAIPMSKIDISEY